MEKFTCQKCEDTVTHDCPVLTTAEWEKDFLKEFCIMAESEPNYFHEHSKDECIIEIKAEKLILFVTEIIQQERANERKEAIEKIHESKIKYCPSDPALEGLLDAILIIENLKSNGK